MAPSIFLLFLLFLLSISFSSAKWDLAPSTAPTPAPSAAASATPKIWKACKCTRFPISCQTMLAQSGRVPPDASSEDLVQLALLLSAENVETSQSMVKEILECSAQNPNRSKVAQTCLESLSYSSLRTAAADEAMTRGMLKDARAWVSSALSFQFGCWGGLKYVADIPIVNKTRSYFENDVIVATSNALSMIRALDVLGHDSTKWGPPRTERNGFWEPILSSGSGQVQVGSVVDILAGKGDDAEVCKVGCRYTTVQEAVNAAPENLKEGEMYLIRIMEGVYEEIVRVPFDKKNLVFLGDGMGKTVITGSLSVGLQGLNTYHTATVGVLSDGFMASGLTFENTAGPGAEQAVAFRSDSDFSYIENCEFLGNQDTLYAHSLRQLYSNCRIEGNVDFIFGNAAAIFHNCTILIRPRLVSPEKGESNAITAHGRSDPVQTTGFAFVESSIDGTPEYLNLYHTNPKIHNNYLGRPWKMYSRTVFINCTMGEIINPEGWLPWDGDFALSTLYYGEYGNSGSGSIVAKRVPWSSFISVGRTNTFTVENFLQGDQWITKKAY